VKVGPKLVEVAFEKPRFLVLKILKTKSPNLGFYRFLFLKIVIVFSITY